MGKKKKSNDIKLYGILIIALILLKAFGVLKIPWWLATMPIYGPIAAFLLIFIITIFIPGTKADKEQNTELKRNLRNEEFEQESENWLNTDGN